MRKSFSLRGYNKGAVLVRPISTTARGRRSSNLIRKATKDNENVVINKETDP